LNLLQEVEAFQRFLDNEGGHYGGWKEKDHLFFIKTRKKYPVRKTAEIVHENFPGISLLVFFFILKLEHCFWLLSFKFT
jgi:hypothetical protein